jgi:hypothetical protein
MCLGEQKTMMRISLERHWLISAVLALSLLHSLVYVVTLPAWDLFDEEQHLDYALGLRDGRIPTLDDTIRFEIAESAFESDRWKHYRINQPDQAPDPAGMGLEGRSYEAYQPPLYYTLIALVTIPTGDEALPSLYVARFTGALLFVAFVALTWLLARNWLGPTSARLPTAVALVVAAVPAAAQAGARVSNDLLAATLILGAIVAITKLLDAPSPGTATLTGLLAAAALLTKSHSLVVVPIIAWGLFVLWKRGQASVKIAACCVLPVIVSLGGLTAWTAVRYGTLHGAQAYLDRYQTYSPLPWHLFLKTFWLNSWSDYWGAYQTAGGLLTMTNVLVILLIVAAMARLPGIGLASEHMVMMAILGFGMLALLIYANHTAIARPGGRFLLALYPFVAVLLVAGWRQYGSSHAAFVPAATAWSLAIVYFGWWFLPFFT